MCRPVEWLGDSLKNLRAFPQAVREDMGFAIYSVQEGETPRSAKKLKGLSGVYEIVEQADTDAYRAMYIASLGDVVYVLHAFKKKSKTGIKTPKQDIDLIRQRLKKAKELAKERAQGK